MLQRVVVLAVLTMSGLTGWEQRGSGAATRPSMPREEPNACPFEGCQFGAWTARDTVVARRSRNTSSARSFTVRKGETVTAVTGVLVITRPGRVEFRDRTDLLTKDGQISVEPGDTLYLLGYRGEGFTDAWFKGRTYRAVDGAMAFFNALCDTRPERCSGRVVERQQSTWWVQIRNGAGLVGWTNQADVFDGRDAFGAR
jgi:hypothetical protein